MARGEVARIRDFLGRLLGSDQRALAPVPPALGISAEVFGRPLLGVFDCRLLGKHYRTVHVFQVSTYYLTNYLLATYAKILLPNYKFLEYLPNIYLLSQTCL